MFIYFSGSQQDIEKALAKIRQKFPLRRFPQLTLEKVSFVTLNTLPPLKLEDFHVSFFFCIYLILVLFYINISLIIFISVICYSCS